MENPSAGPGMEPADTVCKGKQPIERVFELLGGPTGVLKVLRAAGVAIKTPWAVNKWLRAGRLPRTEYTGETTYAQILARAVGGAVSAEALLEQGRRSSNRAAAA